MSEQRMITCPNCKSRLSIDRGLRKVYCQYCGQEIGFDSNGNLRIDVNINRNENLDHTSRVINEGDIAREKRKSIWEAAKGIALIMLMIPFVAFGLVFVFDWFINIFR